MTAVIDGGDCLSAVPTMEQVRIECDRLHLAEVFDEERTFLLDVLDRELQDNVMVLALLARNAATAAEDITDKSQQVGRLREGLMYAERAIAMDDSLAIVHKWYGILLGRYGDHLSTKDKIQNAFKIKEHMDKAAALDPADSITLHTLGEWCLEVATIGWATRQMAKALFANPPVSSYEEAEQYFRRAELNNKAGWRKTPLMHANVLVLMGRKDEARGIYQRLVTLPMVTNSDKYCHEVATRKLKGL